MFSRIGVLDAPAAIVLPSWREAIACSSSLEWRNLRLEMANEYRGQLRERSMERFNKRNDTVDDVKKTLVPLVRMKIEPESASTSCPRNSKEPSSGTCFMFAWKRNTQTFVLPAPTSI
jgi:hypothetical protein